MCATFFSVGSCLLTYWYMLHYFISCSLLETGDCRGFIPRWYYNINNTKCETFTYGGCGVMRINLRQRMSVKEIAVDQFPATEGRPSINHRVLAKLFKSKGIGKKPSSPSQVGGQGIVKKPSSASEGEGQGIADKPSTASKGEGQGLADKPSSASKGEGQGIADKPSSASKGGGQVIADKPSTASQGEGQVIDEKPSSASQGGDQGID
ncbi:hypothetical protein OS493_018808 [Desmophyllum pertusum]|uniref:BPTI/Kunitz inhibitor domain-containing protein n=1 Tax=Desmophyllum pertusum TaxID=174260 RepID=A0A9W9ZF53_9CNID|nr:hypothetical protein OS493_018808 [Desmophyllum pertusum]